MSGAPQEILLKTKLLVPPIRTDRIPRTRIVASLNEAIRYPLTLVSSLAGSGKTTALVEWANQLTLPVGWYSIDEGDNDANLFLNYFIAAVQTAIPGAGKIAFEATRSPEPLSPVHILALLINELADIQGDFIIVLDDYQLIKTIEIHQAIGYLIEHCPTSLHLVMASRADPDLPLAKLRARNLVMELRMDQLRFSGPETSAYLNEICHLGLSDDEITTLQLRTEGWIASLQMAALSIKGISDDRTFIRQFSVSNRYILDYLFEEVFKVLPEKILSFLLTTYFLDRLNGPLCDAVINESGSQSILVELERENLFVVPLDEERHWYRYHHLFRDLISAQISRVEYANTESERRLRASAWFENNGMYEDAIQQAIAGCDFTRAVRIIETIAERTWMDGRYSQLIQWTQSVPLELVERRPWLCVWNAWSYSQTGTLADVLMWIAFAEKAITTRPSDETTNDARNKILFDQVDSLKAFTIGLGNTDEEVIRLAERILKNPPLTDNKSSLYARCNIQHGLSSWYYATGDLDKAEQTCLETIHLARETGFILRLVHAANRLSYIYKAKGQLHKAYQVVMETLKTLRTQGFENYFVDGLLKCRLVDLYYEWNQLDESRRWMVDCLSLSQLLDLPYFMVDLLTIQARDYVQVDDFFEAQKILDRAANYAGKSFIWSGIIWKYETLQVKLWLKNGDLFLASAWVAEESRKINHDLDFPAESVGVSRSRVLISKGAYSEALELLSRLEEKAEAGGRQGSLVEIMVLKAIACQYLDQWDEGVVTLKKAISLAEQEGYLRTFLDEGIPIYKLLKRIIQAPDSQTDQYAHVLFDKMKYESSVKGQDPNTGSSYSEVIQPRGTGLAEPLTRRELEVLQCMAEGLSNKETARKLTIENSTVKRHINNIFSKLGAKNRVQALLKAKEIHLIKQ